MRALDPVAMSPTSPSSTRDRSFPWWGLLGGSADRESPIANLTDLATNSCKSVMDSGVTTPPGWWWWAVSCSSSACSSCWYISCSLCGFISRPCSSSLLSPLSSLEEGGGSSFCLLRRLLPMVLGIVRGRFTFLFRGPFMSARRLLALFFLALVCISLSGTNRTDAASFSSLVLSLSSSSSCSVLSSSLSVYLHLHTNMSSWGFRAGCVVVYTCHRDRVWDEDLLFLYYY